MELGGKFNVVKELRDGALPFFPQILRLNFASGEGKRAASVRLFSSLEKEKLVIGLKVRPDEHH